MSATKIIVSYDGTNNENDAVALGRVFARAGAEVALAYVRHTQEPEPEREVLAEQEAEALLQRGVELLGVPAAAHVVADRSTPEGLRALAEREGADAIVFCSDSHTAPRHVTVGNSAQRLLDGGRFAIAIASAGLADVEGEPVQRIAVTEDPTDSSAQATADALAQAIGASVSSRRQRSRRRPARARLPARGRPGPGRAQRRCAQPRRGRRRRRAGRAARCGALV